MYKQDSVCKFNFTVVLQNSSDKMIEVNEWYAQGYVGGRQLVTCFYGYGTGFPSVAAGEARTVTFASFLEYKEAVTEVHVLVRDGVVRLCFAGDASQIGCP